MSQKKHQKTEDRYRVLLEINNVLTTCRDLDSQFDELTIAFGSVVSLVRDEIMPQVRHFVDQYNTEHGRSPASRDAASRLWNAAPGPAMCGSWRTRSSRRSSSAADLDSNLVTGVPRTCWV